MKAPLLTPHIEALESRIAPAVLASPTSVTYTDIDGDQVTISISKGTLTAADFVFNTEFGVEGPQQLLLINFAGDSDKVKADLSIEVASPVGDGLAHVGFIDATGIDLKNVTVSGDLGRINLGDAVKSTPAVDELRVASIGIQPVASTQQAGGNLVSTIVGKLNTLTVTGDVNGALLDVSSSIAVIEIGGDLRGGTDAKSGSIRSGGSLLSVHIAGDIVGGDADDSGQVFARHDIGSLTLDGSLIGGNLLGSHRSGQIAANDRIGTVTIGGDMQGGMGDQSAQIAARDGITSVAITGALAGGAGLESGIIGSNNTIASVVVKGGVEGGDGPSSGSILADATITSVIVGDPAAHANLIGGAGERSGIIATTKGLKNVTVNGSVIGGSADTTGAIGSTKPLGTIQILGDIVGGSGPRSGEVVSASSIDSVSVGGNLYGGGGDESGAIGSTGAMKSVTIGGDFLGSNGFRSGWLVSGGGIGSIKIGGSAGSTGGFSGIIEGQGRIGLIDIDGDIGNVEGSPISITAKSIGSVDVGGSIFSNGGGNQGSINARKSIGSITVADDISASAQFFAEFRIRAGTSIGSIDVGGSVFNVEIVAGGGFDDSKGGGRPANPDAKIGTITVGRSWIGTRVAVGTLSGSDGLYGTIDDIIAHGGNSAVFSTIDKVTIGGGVARGLPFSSSGIVAELIRSVVINAEPVALKAGALNDLVNVGSASGDFFIREKAFDGGTA